MKEKKLLLQGEEYGVQFSLYENPKKEFVFLLHLFWHWQKEPEEHPHNERWIQLHTSYSSGEHIKKYKTELSLSQQYAIIEGAWLAHGIILMYLEIHQNGGNALRGNVSTMRIAIQIVDNLSLIHI